MKKAVCSWRLNMPAVEKARRTRNSRKLISVSAKEALDILAAVKKIDPEAHFIEGANKDESFTAPQDSKWYRDVKASWHPGINLRIRRENAGYTQAQLADIAGLAAANISAIENGRRSMGLNVAKKLAAALKRPISEFFEEGNARN
jgi:DNA-binding XRE family transcriptional regulator